jgi:hypothetical protein
LTVAHLKLPVTLNCPGQAPAVKRQPGGLEDFAKDATLMSLRARLIAAATNLLLTAHSSLTMAVVRDPLAAPSCKLQKGAWFFMHCEDNPCPLQWIHVLVSGHLTVFVGTVGLTT